MTRRRIILVCEEIKIIYKSTMDRFHSCLLATRDINSSPFDIIRSMLYNSSVPLFFIHENRGVMRSISARTSLHIFT